VACTRGWGTREVSCPWWTAVAGNRGARSGDLTGEQMGRQWGWTRGTARRSRKGKKTGLSGVSTARRSEEVTADAHTRALQQKQDWQQQREADMMLPSGAAQGKLCGREGDRSVLSPACYKWHGAA
jgi:hypothetical protein